MADQRVLRRVPRRARGQQRIAAILDAAARLFAEVGYEAATTNAIAARAQTSIGSLYQFFPNKEAILHALAARYLEDLRAFNDNVLRTDVAGTPAEVVIDRVVEGLAEFHATKIGFQAVFYGSPVPNELASVAEELQGEIVERVDAIMAAYAPRLDPTRRRLSATISVAAVKELLPIAEAAEPGARAQVLAEIKALLLAYVQSVVARGEG